MLLWSDSKLERDLKDIDASEDRYVLSHYRDKDKREIDYLITGPHVLSMGEDLWAVPITCIYG